MSRRLWAGITYLLALFVFLWAKLPGPPSQEEKDPLCKFRAKRKKKEGDEIIEISTNAATLGWLSDQITGITLQEVKPLAGGGYVADRDPMLSEVEVEIKKPDTAELRDLSSEMKGLLLSGSGQQVAIVTGIVKGGWFDKQKEIYARGRGRGAWEIMEIVE